MLSASALKLLACGFMLIDHAGLLLFPEIRFMRIIGRLAFPIFAFFIAEGCRHTRSRLRHFLSVFVLGFLCQAVYVLYSGVWFMNILLTFSLSIALCYLMMYCAEKKISACWTGFALSLAAVYVLTRYVDLDYGFTGIVAPLFAAAPDCFSIVFKRDSDNASVPLNIKLGFFAFGIMLTCIKAMIGPIQVFAMLTLPLLSLYSGRPGTKKMKYFFYIFYPVHLLALEGLAMIM